MKQTRIWTFLLSLSLVLILVLSGCGPEEEAPASVAPSSSPSAEPSPSPSEDIPDGINPLTGLPMEEEYEQNRPIAVMLNNLKAALPQHGVSQADIIYEVPAEGGITRMLGVYQSVDGVGSIGTVRSTRTYYLDLAQGHDAILIHAGGSPDAYRQIRSRGVTALDGLSGTYGTTLFWRDSDRIRSAGYEHSMFTSGEKILDLFPAYSFRQIHDDDYACNLQFQEDGTPDEGKDAENITVVFSTYKTGIFTYDADEGVYYVSQYGTPYMDGETDTQVSVTNVLVLRTSISVISGDTAGRLNVVLTGSGQGVYACGGKMIDILWSKASADSQFVYTLTDGTPLALGEGRSYINIIGKNASVTAS